MLQKQSTHVLNFRFHDCTDEYLLVATYLMQQVSHVSEREVLNQQAYMLFYVRDRKNPVPKKPSEVAQKENMKVSVNASRASATLNQALKKEGILNSQAENLFNGTSSTAQKNTLNIDLSRASLTKDGPIQQRNSPVILENSLMQSKESVSEPSSQKISSEVLSVGNSGLECLLPIGQHVKDCSHPHNQKTLVAPAANEISKCNENGHPKEHVKDTPSMAPSVSDPKTVTAQTVMDENSQKVDVI